VRVKLISGNRESEPQHVAGEENREVNCALRLTEENFSVFVLVFPPLSLSNHACLV
jgi:hypothetical protein